MEFQFKHCLLIGNQLTEVQSEVLHQKHAHLFMAPLNYLTRPDRTSIGELQPLDFEDDDREQFGVNKLEDLHQTQIFDGLACIMCNRCQDVCPAYLTGKELSPSALEVNKRYYMKEHWTDLANGAESDWSLMGTVISESAVWACTSCAACIDICPVGCVHFSKDVSIHFQIRN